MKILKIFGIVVGIHLFALILIFANPGCSSTTNKPATPVASDAATASNSTGAASTSAASVTPAPAESAATSSAITFNPDTPAAAAPASNNTGVRFTPTRPGTPVAGALVTEAVTDVTPASSYTVKSGDNLWTIARKNNTTVAQLTAANNLSANANLRPGQKLIIPSKSASAALTSSPTASTTTGQTAAAAAAARTDTVTHVVKSGETLGAIARKYQVSQGELAVTNNMVDPTKIRPGMELIIPGFHPPASKSKSGKSTTTASKSSVTASKSAPPPAPVSTFEPTPLPTPPPATPTVPVIQIGDASSPAPKQP